MEAYLDNSATTRVFPEVQELMCRLMDREFGNPSSLHLKGVEAEKEMRLAAERIASTLKAEPKNIIFTSGGTESNNLALVGTALGMRRKGKHLITTAVEHASVKAPLAFLQEEGFEVTWLPTDSRGRISLKELEKALRPDTTLVSVMGVNNEIGTIEPFEEAAALVHGKDPDIVFHVDAIQAYGKLRMRPSRQGIDLLSVSGHKIHGPKGSGFLYCDPRVKLHPLILGGGQQRGMRSGTENVPGNAGLGLAAEMVYADFEKNHEHLEKLHRHFLTGLHLLEGVTVNGFDETVMGDEALALRSPHIVSASFEGVRSEVLLHALEERKVYVSSGSACSSNHPSVSRTLQAIGVRKDLLESTLRFSFSIFTTEEELDAALAALNELLPVLRRFRRK